MSILATFIICVIVCVVISFLIGLVLLILCVLYTFIEFVIKLIVKSIINFTETVWKRRRCLILNILSFGIIFVFVFGLIEIYHTQSMLVLIGWLVVLILMYMCLLKMD